MANAHKHPLRCVRGVPQADWDAFGKAATEANTDRSAVVGDFIRWYIRTPDVPIPERPE
jgi:hypothetical protein